MATAKEKLDSVNLKKIIKASTLFVGLILVVFISFFNATFDFSNFNWEEWLANSSVLVGIMIFGILMGNSTGTDIQQEKTDGLYQINAHEYDDVRKSIEYIRQYFSQFWLWYKERKLIEKKVDYLISNQFDGRVATAIVKNIEKEDLVSGKMLYNIAEPTEKIYIKNGIKFKKLDIEQLKIVEKIFGITLDTYSDSYYLYLHDGGEVSTNDAELGKKINNKIRSDKRLGFTLKIISSLVISIAWGALTIYELTKGGGDAQRKAWLNLISRVSALFTSYLSGFSTSVINVKDQARAIENKIDILKCFKSSYESKDFVPETYDQMIEREYQEQISAKSLDKVEETNVE